MIQLEFDFDIEQTEEFLDIPNYMELIFLNVSEDLGLKTFMKFNEENHIENFGIVSKEKPFPGTYNMDSLLIQNSQNFSMEKLQDIIDTYDSFHYFVQGNKNPFIKPFRTADLIHE